MEASTRILPRLAVLALVVTAVGLPVNTLSAFGVLAAIVLVVFTGSIDSRTPRWLGAVAFAAFALAIHLFLPAPRRNCSNPRVPASLLISGSRSLRAAARI